MKTKGIQEHPWMKLGKAPAKRDERNLRLSAVLVDTGPPPESYDYDFAHPGINTPMFGNDDYGCCVIAARAHQTMRFENLEVGRCPPITTEHVLKEYFRQTGGRRNDNGLVLLESLKQWRRVGWRIDKKQLRIKGFAEIDRLNHDQVKRAIYNDVGIAVGLNLPRTAQNQFQAGTPWDVVAGMIAGDWGGHCVYVVGYTAVTGYNAVGPVCVTWGRKHQMTWAFWDQICDEAYAVFDAKDFASRKASMAINYDQVNEYMKTRRKVAA